VPPVYKGLGRSPLIGSFRNANECKHALLQGRLQQLKAQQQRIAARQRATDARRERKEDTRRKILIGAIVLARIEQGRLSETEVRGWMNEALTRADDRALFDLPERTAAASG
jgi:hypothetical protein